MRVTIKQLENKVRHLNKIAGTPETSYTRNADGKLTANIGNYHIDQAYGGCQLVQMVTDGGGIRTIFPGHVPKRECAALIDSYMQGILDGLEK